MREWKTNRSQVPADRRQPSGMLRRLVSRGLCSVTFATFAVANALAGATAQDIKKIDDLANQNWYQIDVVIFKPKNGDLSEESWPESDVSYPANVYSVYPADIFKLSQLEQLEPLGIEQTGQTRDLNESQFAFEGRANRNRNQRIVAAATANRQSTPEFAQTSQANSPDQDIPSAQEPSASIEAQIQSALSSVSDTIWDQAYQRTENSSSLTTIARSVNRSSRFTLLSHYSWVQPIGSEQQPVMIQTGNRYNDQYEIEGTLAFSRSRFLHVDTNLWYTRFEPRGTTPDPYRSAISSTLDDATLKTHKKLVDIERERGQYYPVQQHIMSQSRRMRSDELHYLDHPLIGIVIRINRYDPEQDISAN